MSVIVQETAINENGCPIIVGSAASKYVRINFIYYIPADMEEYSCEKDFEILTFDLKLFENGKRKATLIQFSEFTNVEGFEELDQLTNVLGIPQEALHNEEEAQEHNDMEIEF